MGIPATLACADDENEASVAVVHPAPLLLGIRESAVGFECQGNRRVCTRNGTEQIRKFFQGQNVFVIARHGDREVCERCAGIGRHFVVVSLESGHKVKYLRPQWYTSSSCKFKADKSSRRKSELGWVGRTSWRTTALARCRKMKTYWMATKSEN